MLIVRGVNVFPSAVREVVSAFAPEVSGHILVRPQAPGVKQEPPLPVSVELARGRDAPTPRSRKRSVRDCATCSSSRRASSSCRGGACGAASTSRSSSSTSRRRSMRKLQSQGVHHITLVGADRQTSIDFWEGVLGMPFVFEQPNLDNASREPSLLRSRRRPPDHGLHQRGARARPAPHADRPRLRAPHRVLALAGDVPPGGRAARRARDPAQRRQGPRLHGLDLLRGSARPR